MQKINEAWISAQNQQKHTIDTQIHAIPQNRSQIRILRSILVYKPFFYFEYIAIWAHR